MQTDASGCAEEMGRQNARAASITGTRAYVGGSRCPPLAVLAELVQSSSCRDVQWSGTSLDRGILGSSSCPCTHGLRPGMEPVAPAVESRSPNHWTTREVLMSVPLESQTLDTCPGPCPLSPVTCVINSPLSHISELPCLPLHSHQHINAITSFFCLFVSGIISKIQLF